LSKLLVDEYGLCNPEMESFMVDGFEISYPKWRLEPALGISLSEPNLHRFELEP
jgi:hypothetical protein